MTRKRLDAQLQAINDQVMHMGELVDYGLESVLAACADGDAALCERVIVADEQVDRLRDEINQSVLRLMTLQQPLGARDLRFLTAVLSIASNLERTGDGAAGIARLQLQILALPEQSGETPPITQSRSSQPIVNEDELRKSLHQLGQEVRLYSQATMQAFASRDTLAARATIQDDDALDIRYHILCYDLMSLLKGLHAVTSLQQDIYCLQRITYMLWIAHKLERVGDHCVNICERTIYIVEGSPKCSSPPRSDPQRRHSNPSRLS